MAENVGSAAASAGAKAALNSFMNPSIDIVKTIPQGIIELLLRGATVVILYTYKGNNKQYLVPFIYSIKFSITQLEFLWPQMEIFMQAKDIFNIDLLTLGSSYKLYIIMNDSLFVVKS